MSREARFRFLNDTQAADAAFYAHGLGYPTAGALARVLVLRAIKQYPLSGRQKSRATESYGKGANPASGVLPDRSAGNSTARARRVEP
ncbi:MAG: hypothetical protein NTZ09_04205 [Candidatus Hydrogenedentes bacterium]|nr:hypothetical protein [Candidatus Hydrogenedentota bacterium]